MEYLQAMSSTASSSMQDALPTLFSTYLGDVRQLLLTSSSAMSESLDLIILPGRALLFIASIDVSSATPAKMHRVGACRVLSPLNEATKGLRGSRSHPFNVP